MQDDREEGNNTVKKTKMISRVRRAVNKAIATASNAGSMKDEVKLCQEGKGSSLTAKEQNRFWKTMKDQVRRVPSTAIQTDR